MSKSSSAPDYTAAAQQQGQNNVQSALLGTQLGRPNEITPFGSQTWSTGTAPSSGAAQTGSGMGGAAGGYGLGGGYIDPSTGQYFDGQSGAGGYGLGGSTPGNYLGAGDPNQYTSTITLAPAQQALLDSQNALSQGLADTATGNLSSVQNAESQPLNLSGLPQLSGAPQSGNVQTSIAPAGDVTGADAFAAQKDNAYQDLMSRGNLQLNQQEGSLKQQLANQGLAPGTDAYNRAQQPLAFARNDLSTQSDLAANQLQQQLIAQANAAQQQRFSQNTAQGQFGNQANAQQFAQDLASGQFGNQARQQGIQEAAYLQQQPLNLLNALRTGSQVTTPQFSQYGNTPVQPAPIMQGALAQGQQDLATQNNTLGGLFGLGSAALGNWQNIFSDRRLKRDIIRVGVSPRGYPWYTFTYICGEPSMGVMSDEVPAEAVIRHESGFDMVDYSKV